MAEPRGGREGGGAWRHQQDSEEHEGEEDGGD